MKIKYPFYNDIDRSRLAVVVILFTVLALAFGDALIKRASTGFTLWQIFVIRSFAAVPLLIVILKVKNRRVSLLPIHLGWVALRSGMLTLMWVFYYIALPQIELSIAAATYYTLPLFITMFAAVFLKNKISALGWTAVLIGFVGVLMVVNPQAKDFNVFALLPIISAILYALAMIITRSKCRTENAFVLSIALNVTMILVGALVTILLNVWGNDLSREVEQQFLFGTWSTMGVEEWITIAVLTCTIIVGSVGAAFAYQNGSPEIIATFDFSYVAFALVWGFLLFSEVPSPQKIIGMVLIIAAGILSIKQSSTKNISLPKNITP